MTKVQNFSENLEKSLSHLGERVSKRFENPESKNLPEREIVKESIRDFASDVHDERETKAAIEENVGSPSVTNSVLPSYLNNSSAPQDAKLEVERLVNIVFRDGLEEAIRASKKTPAFIEDAFHDALVDKLLPELKKRGMLK